MTDTRMFLAGLTAGAIGGLLAKRLTVRPRRMPYLDIGQQPMHTLDLPRKYRTIFATTYWQKANDHADKLDRAEGGASVKQVIRNQLSWQKVW